MLFFLKRTFTLHTGLHEKRNKYFVPFLPFVSLSRVSWRNFPSWCTEHARENQVFVYEERSILYQVKPCGATSLPRMFHRETNLSRFYFLAHQSCTYRDSRCISRTANSGSIISERGYTFRFRFRECQFGFKFRHRDRIREQDATYFKV